MRNLVRLVAKPSNGFENLVKVDLLLGFGVRVVVAEIAVTLVVLGVTKVDGDSLRVTNLAPRTSAATFSCRSEAAHMQEAVRLWRETSENLSTGGFEVLLHTLRVDLLVSSGLVQS